MSRGSSFQAVLEYGREVSPHARRKLTRRRLVKVIVVIALLLAVPVVGYFCLIEHRQISVRLAFGSMPGVDVVTVYTDAESPVNVEVRGAVVRKAGTNKQAYVWVTDGHDVRDTRHVRIVSIGPHDCWAVPEGHLDIGPGGRFAGLLPFEVHGVEDLMKRYDEVVAALAALPPKGVYRGRDGQRHRYEIR
jgi:hypothetical protein